MAFSTAGNAIHPYLGFMEPLRKHESITPIYPVSAERPRLLPHSDGHFETFRGLLTATAIGLSMWAILLLVSWWIWQ